MLSANQAANMAENSSVFNILKIIEEAALKKSRMISISESLFNPHKNESIFFSLGYKINYFTDDETHSDMVEISW